MFVKRKETVINLNLVKTFFPLNREGFKIHFYLGGGDDSVRLNFDNQETRDKVYKQILDALKNEWTYLEVSE